MYVHVAYEHDLISCKDKISVYGSILLHPS